MFAGKKQQQSQARQIATANFAQLGNPIINQRLIRVSIYLLGYAYALSFIFHLSFKRGIIGTILLLVSPSLFGSTLVVYGALAPILFTRFQFYQVERVPHTGYFQGIQLLLRNHNRTVILICAHVFSMTVLNFVCSKILINHRPNFWISAPTTSNSQDGEDGNSQLPQFNQFYLINNIYIFVLGSIYAAYIIVYERLQLQFPIIEQHRVYSIKDRLPDCFYNSVKLSWSFLSRFWVAYFIFGQGLYSTLTTFMCYFVTMASSASYSQRNPLWSPNQMLFLFLSGAFTILSWELTHHLFEIVFTEGTKINELSLDPNACLIDGLKLAQPVYLRYLAYRELYSICTYNIKQRRKDIYKDISRSTGLAWNHICNQLLKVIDDAAKELAITTKDSFPVQQPEEPHPKPTIAESLASETKAADNSPIGAKPDGNKEKEKITKLIFKEDQPSHDIFKVPSKRFAKKPLLDESKSKGNNQYSQGIEAYVLNKLYEMLLQSKLGKKILAQATLSKTFSVFSNFEIQVWTLRSLAILVEKSLDEDDYGVVQKDIPRIMASLSSYLAQLELFVMDPKGTNYYLTVASTAGSNGIRPTTSQTAINQLAFNSQLTHQQSHALIQVTRNCIYKIVLTFYDHLDELKFSPETKQHIELFAKFQG